MSVVEVRPICANVWISEALLCQQDGFLLLCRMHKQELLAYGALEGERVLVRPSKAYQTVAVKWMEKEKTKVLSFSIPILEAYSNSADDETAHVQYGRMEFHLFVLIRNPSNATSRSNRNQQIGYVGYSSLDIRRQDVETLASLHEIVFTTHLQDNLGTIEVKLRSATSIQSGDNKNQHGEALEANMTRGSFSVNWSSSEALEKDLKEKARLQEENEKKLLVRLRKIEATAAAHRQQRAEQILQQQRSRAAKKIQCAYKSLIQYRKEIQDRLRREKEAQLLLKKQKLRDKVVERNRQRAQMMREQLLYCRSKGLNPHQESPSTSNHKERNMNETAWTYDIERLKRERETAERVKLQQRLAELDAEKERKLQRITPIINNLSTTVDVRGARTTDDRHERRRSNAVGSTRMGADAGRKVLNDELIRAIHVLHLHE